jgi:hypothetical protein
MSKQFDLETQEWTEVIDVHEPDEVLPEIDAHGYLIGVYRGTIKANGSRLRAAIAALAFEKPKLQAIALHRDNDLQDRLENARQAREKVIEHRPQEAKSIGEQQVDELPDHSKPFAQDNKSRFRRF